MAGMTKGRRKRRFHTVASASDVGTAAMAADA